MVSDADHWAEVARARRPRRPGSTGCRRPATGRTRPPGLARPGTPRRRGPPGGCSAQRARRAAGSPDRDMAARRGRRAGIRLVPGAVVCVCTLLQLGAQHRIRTPGSRLYDFGAPARYIAGFAHQGDGVLFFNSFYRKARLGYPVDFQKTTDIRLAVPPARAGTPRGVDKPLAITCRLMLQRQRMWVVGDRPSRQLPTAQLRAESMVLESSFSLVAEERFHGMDVTLWGDPRESD